MTTTLQPDASWFEVDPAFYSHGGTCFSEAEMLALVDCAGKQVLVSPASGGEEALSFVSLGATVSIFDSAEMSARARALIAETHVPVQFHEGVPGATDIPGGPYDVVYSSFGILDVLDYFDTWAEGISSALRPGGLLVIHDAHPVSHLPATHQGLFVVANSYFGTDQKGQGASWNLGDLISALGQAGLATLYLEETTDSERYQTPLDRYRNVRWDVRWRLPGAFVLAAIKL